MFVDFSVASKIFPCIKDVVLTRTFGEIHMLVGIDNTVLLPQEVDTKIFFLLIKKWVWVCIKGKSPQYYGK